MVRFKIQAYGNWLNFRNFYFHYGRYSVIILGKNWLKRELQFGKISCYNSVGVGIDRSITYKGLIKQLNEIKN